jgi:hypothetical protein
LTEEEMSGYIARHPELKNGKIDLPTALQFLPVNRILVGGKTFLNPADFIQEFEAGRRGLPKYKRLYSQLVEEFPGSWFEHFDEKDRVIRVEDQEEKVEVTKDIPGDLLFANGNRIHFKASYLNDLFARYANGELMDVLHAGCDFSDEPFELQKMRIYVHLKSNPLIRQVCEFCNQTSIQDRNLSFLLKYTLATMLSLTNTGSPISYFFSKLADECLNVTQLNGKWSTLEGLLEYKNSEYFSGNDDEIVNRLAADFKKKLEKSRCTVYLIGVEDDGTLDLVSKTRLGSDRLSGIRDRLQKGLDLACIYVLSIIKEGRGLIVIPALR